MARVPAAPAVLLAALALALPARGADEVEAPPPRNTFTLRPLHLLGAALEVEYERVLGPSVSVYVSPRLRVGPGVFADTADDTSVLGLGVHGGARLFFLGEAPEGLWLAPEVGLRRTRVRRGGLEESATRVSVLALVGATYLVDGVFVVAAGVGGGVRRGNVDVEEVRADDDVAGEFAVHFNLGFAF